MCIYIQHQRLRFYPNRNDGPTRCKRQLGKWIWMSVSVRVSVSVPVPASASVCVPVNEWPHYIRINIHLINEYLCLIYAKVYHLIGIHTRNTLHIWICVCVCVSVSEWLRPIRIMIHHWSLTWGEWFMCRPLYQRSVLANKSANNPRLPKQIPTQRQTHTERMRAWAYLTYIIHA